MGPNAVSDDLTPWVSDRGPVDPSPHTCTYGQNPGPGCGAPGAWHVAWDLDRGSISCDIHMELAQTSWVYLKRHKISPDCGMPDTRWLPDRCEVVGGPRETAAVASRPEPCGWSPLDATTDCDWDKDCPVHGVQGAERA